MVEYNGQLKNREYDGNEIYTFDIETTSGWITPDGHIMRYHPGRSDDYWNSLQSISLCYIWQFGVNDSVYYGRELSDFPQLLQDLPQKDIIIWVHNLSWEFHFLQGVLDGIEVFARQPHKPMKMITKSFPHIEWRCSYMLTRLSLETWGKSLGVKKLAGDLVYNKIRTPKTPLTEKELAYCERDCIVVYHGIKDYLRRYESQQDIPLTQTGTVRRVVKDLLIDGEDDSYHKWIKRLVPRDAKQYKILQRIFAGGYTHANRLHAGTVQEGIIEHYDFTSHYPTMLTAFKYPSSPWAYIGRNVKLEKLDFENNAYIFLLHFRRIQSTKFNTYIQAVKAGAKSCPYATKACRCKWAGIRYDNGRVISAYDLAIWVTEQDFLTIKESYIWDSMEILKTYKSRKQYLPTPFVAYILELYGNKTSLKGVSDAEQPGAPDLYAQSKQYINSLFGMAVTALMQADITFNDGTKEWGVDSLTEEAVNERLSELRRWFPWEKRYFLSYSWGCWCTAYARRMLWKCLLQCDEDTLYADTDSLFILNRHDFSSYNEWITGELEKAMDYHGLDAKLTRPKDPHGIERPLGVFLKEDDCEEFLTLGAKRYVERRTTDHKLHLTVSGINKKAVYLLKDDITNFRDGFIFDKDFPTVTKNLHTYCYDQPEITWPDGYKSTYKYGITLRPTGYTLHMTDDYKKLINYQLKPGQLPGRFINHMRGRFSVDG